jgi:hypothetical protein
MKTKKTEDYLKAARKGSREAEIEMYGKPLNHKRIVKSKKMYDRKKMRADDKRHSPLLFYNINQFSIFKDIHKIFA